MVKWLPNVLTAARLIAVVPFTVLLARATDAPLVLSPANTVVHDTGDPEVIIAEFDYHVTITTTGQTLTVPNIQVFRVRAGKQEDPPVYGNDIVVVDTSGAKSFMQNFSGGFGLVGMLLRPW